AERIDTLEEEHLAAPDIADAGERPLVEERLADRRGRPCRVAEASDRLILVERRREEVGPESGKRRMDRLCVRVEQLDHRRVEADGDRAFDLERDDRPCDWPSPPLARPIAMPRPVH